MFIVIALAAGVFFVSLQHRSHHGNSISYGLFRVDSDWGYNILVNDTILIHQDRIPVFSSSGAFESKEQAIAAARLVISKIKAKKSPSLDRGEIENIVLGKN
jgi:hypothetical protein